MYNNNANYANRLHEYLYFQYTIHVNNEVIL